MDLDYIQLIELNLASGAVALAITAAGRAIIAGVRSGAFRIERDLEAGVQAFGEDLAMAGAYASPRQAIQAVGAVSCPRPVPWVPLHGVGLIQAGPVALNLEGSGYSSHPGNRNELPVA